MRPLVKVGCSGYEYPHWRGVFYPEQLKRTAWFDHYASVFDTVEINNTFYGLPPADTFDRWRERAPTGFTYTLKMSRYGTHQKKLRDPKEWVDNFLQRAERLRTTLGPILVQLPPRWRANPQRLEGFLAVAPSRHRWVLEFRDTTWLTDPIFEIMRKHNAALCLHDLATDHPQVVTADWTYLRFHGPQTGTKYAGSYSPSALSGAARRIGRHLAEGRDVYVYFNNDAGGAAVKDAQTLKQYLSD